MSARYETQGRHLPASAGCDEAAEDPILDQAEAWWVRLNAPQATEADRAAFAEWRLSDPAHADAYQRVEALWAASGGYLQQMMEKQKLQGYLAAARTPAPLPARSRRYAWPVTIAASALLMLGVGLNRSLFFNTQLKPQVYASPLGEQRQIVLDDGSKITLDTATRIEVLMDKQSRRLTLARGQARFEVSPDPNKPFEVTAGSGTVTVLGTVFDVRNTDDRIAVTLLEGSVKVAMPKPAGTAAEPEPQTAVLQPGNRVVYTRAEGLSVPVSVDLASARGWAEGKLIFQHVALGEAIAEFNRYTSRKLELTDPTLAELSLYGTFKVNDPQGFVRAVTRLFPIVAQYRGNHIELHPRSDEQKN